jgi:hypothetical protein
MLGYLNHYCPISKPQSPLKLIVNKYIYIYIYRRTDVTKTKKALNKIKHDRWFIAREPSLYTNNSEMK